MPTVLKFEELEIWKLARQLYQNLSPIIKKVKINHDYRFADQIKSACGSVMDNIAEGFERNSRLEFVNSLGISKGECSELKSQLYRLLDDSYINETEFGELYKLCDKELKKIANFMKYLNSTDVKGLKFKGRK